MWGLGSRERKQNREKLQHHCVSTSNSTKKVQDFFFKLIYLFFAVVKEVKSKTEIFYSCVTV